MTHEKLLNKLYYEDLNFIGVNPLYNLAKKHDKTITKEFVSNWLKNQSTQQQTTKMVKKKEYKPIYSEDYYAYQIDLTFLNKLGGCARSTSPARRLEYPLSRFALGDGASHRILEWKFLRNWLARTNQPTNYNRD